jgi:chromosome segregation ATPase
MLNFLKKKKKEENPEEASGEANGEGGGEKKEEKKEKPLSESVGNNPGLIKLSTEVDRIKASIEAFTEVRKSFTERFTRISEQIGELRSMILERDKTIQEIELKAIKSADLVESVHPEKIMTQVQKQDAKTEALKANLEGNESIMERVMEELKETKKKIEFFRGIEEIIKLSEEVKKELIEIKRIESQISINTDKVETIYSEMRKKFQVVDTAESQLQEMKVGMEQNTKDVTFLKDRITGLASKEEVEKLVNKVQKYVDALKEIQKKSSLSKDIEKIQTIIEGLK